MPSRITACGLHPGYKGGHGTGFVARMKSGVGVKKNDYGASSRIAACGLHPGYKGRAYAVVARMRPEGSLMNVKPWQGQTIRGCRPDVAFQ